MRGTTAALSVGQTLDVNLAHAALNLADLLGRASGRSAPRPQADADGAC